MSNFDEDGDLWIDVQGLIPPYIPNETIVQPAIEGIGWPTKINVTEYIKSIIRNEREMAHNSDGLSIMHAELRGRG